MRFRSTRLRALVAGLAASAIAGPALAQACVQPAERVAFEVRALQSQLMVAALSCGRDADYNAFVRKFQGELASSYRGMQGHFRRTAGNGHQREMDGFITTLANAHSQDGIRAGSHFCPLVSPLFQQALAQRDAAALADFAVERNVINPLAAPACPDRPTPATAPRPARPTGQRTASN